MTLRALLAVGAIAATVACATPAPRPWVSIRGGQAPQRCAEERGHGEFNGKPHTHATFYFEPLGVRPAPGDTIHVEVIGTKAVFDYPAGPTVTLEFPAGLGSHEVRAEWRNAQGGTIAASTSYLSVYDCGIPSL